MSKVSRDSPTEIMALLAEQLLDIHVHEHTLIKGPTTPPLSPPTSPERESNNFSLVLQRKHDKRISGKENRKPERGHSLKRMRTR